MSEDQFLLGNSMGQSESKADIFNEFEKLEEGAKAYSTTKDGQCSAGKESANISKNRYMNILPFDATRVRLTENDGRGDYINANFIRLDDQEAQHTYIATQGPTDQTLTDFWEMIWEQNTNTIIMLANEYEAGRSKVTRYWPDDPKGIASYGTKDVVFESEQNNKDYCIRNFTITNVETDQSRKIRQFHYTSWPDFGVPESGDGVMAMRRDILEWQSQEPPIVHCSAGVGRTGTFVAIDTGLAMQQSGREADIYKLTETMKRQRHGMVQTPEQYEFIYTTLRQAKECVDE
eukprot:CFRG3803T1